MRPIPPVAPVFSRRYQAVCFILVSVLSLLAPLIMPKVLPVKARYETVPWGLGDYAFMREQIFEESRPVDVLFLGPSAVWAGINPDVVEQALTARSGREATVLNFGANFFGHELAYFLLRDTLLHRRVRLVVLGVPSPTMSTPHVVTPYMLDVYRDAALIDSAPPRARLTYYAAAVLGAPRQLLSLVRPNRALNDFEQARHLIEKSGHGQHYETRADRGTVENVDDADGDAWLTKGNRRIVEDPPEPHQEALLRAIAALCEQSGTRLTLVHMPRQTDDASVVVLPVSDLLDGRLRLIAPASKFMFLEPDGRAAFFRNAGHLNYRGSIQFTRDILPAVLSAYDDHAD